MRNRLPVYIMLVCGLLCGCKENEKETGCTTGYDPTNAKISWTDYNSIRDMQNYFQCYQVKRELRDGDTIRIWGYLYRHAEDITYDQEIIYLMRTFNESICLTFRVDDLSSGRLLVKCVNNEKKVDLSGLLADGGYKEGQKVYITAIASEYDEGGHGCCKKQRVFKAIEVHK